MQERLEVEDFARRETHGLDILLPIQEVVPMRRPRNLLVRDHVRIDQRSPLSSVNRTMQLSTRSVCYFMMTEYLSLFTVNIGEPVLGSSCGNPPRRQTIWKKPLSRLWSKCNELVKIGNCRARHRKRLMWMHKTWGRRQNEVLFSALVFVLHLSQ